MLWLFANNCNALWHVKIGHDGKVVLWLFANNCDALWHVKIGHDAEVVLWLLKEMTTTSSDFMEIPQGVVVRTFHSHDAM